MHRLVFALPLLLLTAAAPPDVTGHWVTEDGTGLIAISRCGNSVCGKVAKALVIKPGHPKTDVKNPDPALRKRPVIGMTILSGFKAEDGEWKNGRIYDPESGKTYRSRLPQQGRLAQGFRLRFLHLPIPTLDPPALKRGA